MYPTAGELFPGEECEHVKAGEKRAKRRRTDRRRQRYEKQHPIDAGDQVC